MAGIALFCENTEKIKPPYTCKVRSNIRFNEYNGVGVHDPEHPTRHVRARWHVHRAVPDRGRNLPGGAAIPSKGVKDYIELDLYFSAKPTPGRYVVIIANLKDDSGYGSELQSGRLGFLGRFPKPREERRRAPLGALLSFCVASPLRGDGICFGGRDLFWVGLAIGVLRVMALLGILTSKRHAGYGRPSAAPQNQRDCRTGVIPGSGLRTGRPKSAPGSASDSPRPT